MGCVSFIGKPRLLLSSRMTFPPVARHPLDFLPCSVPSGRAARVGSGLRAARLRAPSTPHVSRRQRYGRGLGCWKLQTSRAKRRKTMIKLGSTQLWVHDQDEAFAFYT